MGLCFNKGSHNENSSSNAQENKANQQSHNGQKVISTTQYKSKTGTQMSDEDKTMASLKRVRDDLNNRLQQIDKGIKDAEEEAKKHMRAGNKTRVKFALERKQLYSKYEDNVMNQGKTINSAILQLKETQDNKAAADALKQANKLMIDINKAIDLDSMQDAMGNLQELEMNNDQFNELYQQYVGAGSEEVDEQYKQLEADVFKEDLQKHDMNQPLPNLHIPQQQQQQQQQKVEPIIQQQPQKSQQKQQKDELDDELAMLA